MSTLKVDSILNTAGVDNRGKVIQFIHNANQLARPVTTSGSFVDTGFYVKITPKYASSKIIVWAQFFSYSPNNYVVTEIRRDTTQIQTNPGGNVGFGYSGYQYWNNSFGGTQDEPNTTSEVTYRLYFYSNSGANAYIGNSGTVPTGTETQGIHLYAIEVAQ